ncbi:stage VI sporulation protein D [Gracilibacillus thailandensis]|uniref:Stage VI sporulation protein D n=1 Tax=Gracilibacillus thailandensis TaxID=563735 RepID=A0A6N7R1L8_9BACI|nr:stage VI sporulation protein D [Gracilibacillus thailandensis]MRI67582.1 stage VI sporulation protein D [Gracilibacillus thailandensis]
MQEAFTFNIHEAIAFDKDQQIQEMLGIGLEPVISMEEIGNTLSIRGVMELKGEYIRNDAPVESEVRQTDATFVERVESLSDEVNEFFHKFLIDVSIPMERIPSLDDVSIEVDHFDYTLESANEMAIEATLAIQGIEEPQVEAEIQEEETLPSFEENRMDEELEEEEDTFHLEVEPELDNEPEEEKVVDISSVRNDSETVEEEDSIDEQEENLVREPEDDFVLENDEEEEENAEDKLHVQAREERTNDTSYLLNIFAGEESASYTRLKLYIVQPDDQMQTIAERYQVSPRQIMRTNRLEEEDITAGQLIYIPITSED